MDRNSLIGLGLIAVILGVWLWFSGPSKEQIARNKFVKDSVEQVKREQELKILQEDIARQKQQDSLSSGIVSSVEIVSDSVKQSLKKEYYKDFEPATEGTPEYFTIENDLLKLTIAGRGAAIVKAELKNFHRADGQAPLALFEPDSTQFSLKINAYERSRVFSTDSFYFKKVDASAGKITLRLQTAKENSYIDFTYSLSPGSYKVQSEFVFKNMQQIITPTEDQMQLNWAMLLPSQEKYIVKEKEVATIYYKNTIDKPDNINPFREEELSISEADIKWVSFKQQFFNSTIIASNSFAKAGSYVKSSLRENSPNIVKAFSTELGIPFNHGASEKFSYSFYFGPNDYNILKSLNEDLEKIIPTGWWIFSYINKWLVIPLFDSLSFMNMGIVILILTLIIKVLLLPIAYKTYLSGARMRVLKPELDALNAKLGDKADPMKKQQEQMTLYRKAGVNPLSGCIPLLLQFPILIALFAFIPAAIQLRQKGFLWADDLSTYDSIWTFGDLPFIGWAYGDHVSLFALLMFISTIIYTYMNSNLMPQQNNQMPGMKFMMYFMPVIFLAVMNKYAAGLSWYYFLANMITFLQNFIMKKVISDTKLRAEIEANMKKPAKKSGFQKRLEEMARKQRELQKR